MLYFYNVQKSRYNFTNHSANLSLTSGTNDVTAEIPRQ